MNINEFIKENENHTIEKYNLPDKSVIYFICEKDGLIIYIGTAVNLQTRIKEHFVRVEFFNKPVFFFFHPIEKCRKLEKALINQIKPKYNIQWNKQRNKKREKHEKYIRSEDIWKPKLKKASKIRKKIIESMAKKGINSTDLAELIGISRQRVHQVLKGKSTMHDKTIIMFEKALESAGLVT